MRKYLRRGSQAPNAFKPYNAEEIKKVFLLKETGYRNSSIAGEIGRSTSSVTNLVSFIKGLLKHSWEENSKRLNASRLSKKSVEAIKTAYEELKRDNLSLPKKKLEKKQFVNIESIETPERDSLDQAINNLNSVFEELKEKVIELVDIAVEEKTQEFKKEKEKEIKALKLEMKDMETVVEVAKESNLLDILRKKLRGS